MFAEYGLTLDSLVVQNVSLPEELQKILDQKIGMNMIGDMGRFTQYQVANAIPEAAKNEGGMAGMGVGLGAGVGFGQVMGQAMASAMPASGAAPAVAAAPGWLPALRCRPTKSSPRWKNCTGWLKKVSSARPSSTPKKRNCSKN
jgi:membrane protease subunit (stomatin/prohibitin family)